MYDFIVTGGCGFIGSHFIDLILSKGYSVLNIDRMTYVSWKNIGFESHPQYDFLMADICDLSSIPKCDFLVNFAAESFVDNSISNSEVFFKSNVKGVHTLLEQLRMKAAFDRAAFIQVSTDEVYGDILEGGFKETDVLKPSNPYAATKAAAEQLVFAYHRTYGIDYIITRCSNNYGTRQYPEKLIPKAIMCAQTGRKMTVHGDGSYVRSWINAIDHSEAILALIEQKAFNEIYNICGEEEFKNLEIVETVYKEMGFEPNIQFVPNRWGQDLRYALNIEKIKKAVDWAPRFNLNDSMKGIIEFYREKYGPNTKTRG
ncbi:MAG: GDP-mannose 4,6-dehydratase [Bacteroidetes bacterium]|nr:GDP-mannose 4,6-dehydratase [Bacteroidota bacterium]MBU1719998.1 GDP-mannose 4,6-dehydratase [Bacteroidota bacterium]